MNNKLRWMLVAVLAIVGVGFCLLSFIQAMPRRLSYEEGVLLRNANIGFLACFIVALLVGLASFLIQTVRSNRILGVFVICSATAGLLVCASAKTEIRSIVSGKNQCLNHQKAIDVAQETLVKERGIPKGSPISLDQLTPFFPDGLPKCPSGGTYLLGVAGQAPHCSIKDHNL